MKINPNLNHLRALGPGKNVAKVSAVSLAEKYNSEPVESTFPNYSHIRKKIVDAYYPSTEVKETPLTIYKYNAATKTIKKINIIDNKI